MTRTVAFIQARMSSTRLPGKVLARLQDRPLVAYMAQRAMRAHLLDEVVVVTSSDPSDDLLETACATVSVPVFRGELDDVLKRYVDAAAAFAADEIVRLTGDCPLIDPSTIDNVIRTRRDTGADYASNIDPPTFPDGLDVECFTRDALLRANMSAALPSEREHVTLWMRSATAGLHRANHRAIGDFSALRVTVDYADDLDVVRRLLERLPADGAFDLSDLLRVLSNDPSLGAANLHERNEGLAKSVAAEGGVDR